MPPCLPYSTAPELRILLIGTDPYGKPMWQLEVCPHYKSLQVKHAVEKCSYFLSYIKSNLWILHEEAL